MLRHSFALALALAVVLPASAHAWDRGRTSQACRLSTLQLDRACRLASTEEARLAETTCLNLSDREERWACREEADEARREARGECRAQRKARAELCRAPGFAGPYDPVIDPDDFVEGIDNPYAPFHVGSRWLYEKETDEGLEVVEVEVLAETREILGVTCTSVRDRVFLDGELVEDTVDWVAQDVDGNVWYFGEIALNFEDGRLADIEGSWVAGEDGAKPGYWVKAEPREGELYRQEWLPAEAEDVAQVVDVDSPEPVPFDNGQPVLQTRDFTPLEEGMEFKFYVPGVGLVMEVDPESGERLELVDFTP